MEAYLQGRERKEVAWNVAPAAWPAATCSHPGDYSGACPCGVPSPLQGGVGVKAVSQKPNYKKKYWRYGSIKCQPN